MRLLVMVTASTAPQPGAQYTSAHKACVPTSRALTEHIRARPRMQAKRRTALALWSTCRAPVMTHDSEVHVINSAPTGVASPWFFPLGACSRTAGCIAPGLPIFRLGGLLWFPLALLRGRASGACTAAAAAPISPLPLLLPSLLATSLLLLLVAAPLGLTVPLLLLAVPLLAAIFPFSFPILLFFLVLVIPLPLPLQISVLPPCFRVVDPL
mmetsp:Transcript_2365/g.5933  ORF Transcript_2365/g.5933 Transcript_2365/m.5933 type:complete len:211 (+) Transcript_2365:29-661(+)